MKPRNSVFISYRRTDSAPARLVYAVLQARGFDVFIDYEGLGSGRFEAELLENIAACAHFLLVLTPGALDRIVQPGDWLRREVEHAISLGRNVVPLFLDGFDFADPAVKRLLEGRLDVLCTYNGVRIHFEYFDAAIDRLEQKFLRRPVDVEIQPLSAAALSVAQQQRRVAKEKAPPLPAAPTKALLPQAPPEAHWPADAAVLAARRQGNNAVFEHAGEPAAQRALRAELLDLLVRELTAGTWMPKAAHGRALFQQLLPAATKSALRDCSALLLQTDEPLGALPWELMQTNITEGDGGLPLGVRCALIRQLDGVGPPPTPVSAAEPRALIVANPSTVGFADAFSQPGGLVTLPGARREGELVAKTLRASGWEVQATADEAPAADVLAAFYEHTWRVLHVAGHGVVALTHRNGTKRSGAVLSDGLLLGASDIAHLEQPPELVVLTCEHFGSLRNGAGTDEAGAGLVRALLGSGVRGLVVPAWNVNDDAACTFATALYRALFADAAGFGMAVLAARRAVWLEHPGDSTWASFQAWGDPHWRP